MATVNFSVPDDIRQEFNHLFGKENKSAILTRLMQQAIEEKKQQQRRQLAINKILLVFPCNFLIIYSIRFITPWLFI